MRYTDPAVRPLSLPVTPDTIPTAIKELDQWVLWGWIWNPKRSQWDKPPKQPSGIPASTTDASTWVSYVKALEAYLAGGWDGIGFVLTEAAGVVGGDLDNCRDPETGQIDDWALQILKAWSTYTEASPSARGVHPLTLAHLPGKGRKRGDIEVYAEGRYLTVTGHRLGRHAELQDRQKEVVDLWESLSEAKPRLVVPAASEPLSTDFDLLERARKASNGVAFWALFNGHIEGYVSPSEADLALCNHLAFWTDRDPARMDRLFRVSSLMRGKWDERHGEQTYGEMTIGKALEDVTEGYRPKLAVVSGSAESATGKQLLVRPIAQVRALGTIDVTWVVERFLVEGAITELSALVKAGKSTLLAQMMAAVVHGKPFMGLFDVEQGPVVLLTEERRPSLLAALEDAGIEDSDPLHIAMWYEQTGLPWEQAVSQAANLARDIKARLLVIDTLGRWAGVDDENDASKADLAMAPIQREAVGLAVVVARQAGKAPNMIQNAGRGSSAYAGASDILLHLTHIRDEKNGRLLEEDPRRWLGIISRFERDQIPPMQLVYRGRTYEVIEATSLDSSSSDRVLAELQFTGPSKPFEIVQRTGLNKSTVRSALSRLIRREKVILTDGSYEALHPPVATPLHPVAPQALHPVAPTLLDPPDGGVLHPFPPKGGKGESATPTPDIRTPAVACPSCGTKAFSLRGNQKRCHSCGELYS